VASDRTLAVAAARSSRLNRVAARLQVQLEVCDVESGPVTRPGRRVWRKLSVGLTAIAVAVTGSIVAVLPSYASESIAASSLPLSAAADVAPSVPALQAVGADFNPGNIVSDANFFNGAAMNGAQVQAFLSAQVSVCDYTRAQMPCLKDYTQATPTMAGTLRCAPYQGAASERASDIIAKVGMACGISQKALLVLLQKEQSLVTDSWPYTSQYQHATGYGCPDTAPCDPAYNGFFYQVYWAAYAFQAYRANNGGNYHPGWNTIYWHPNAACGTSQVYIENLATAGLYTYTPYRPNAAALGNLYGVGDACSSYGNRNFWRLWSDWFGSPTDAASNVTGTYEVAQVAVGADSATLLVSGWAFDTADPLGTTHVHLYITGPDQQQTVQGVWASDPRADVGAAYPQAGPNHGWRYSWQVTSGGTYTVCAYGIAKSGPAASLGCRWLDVPTAPPLSAYDVLRVDSVPGQSVVLVAGGWTFQPNLPTATGSVRVQVKHPDGRTETTTVLANIPRADVQAAHGLPGPNHGWSYSLPLTRPGTYETCVYAIGSGWQNSGHTPLIGCRSVDVPGSGGALGSLTSASIVQTTTDATLNATGWALDPTWPQLQAQVHVYSGPAGGAQTVTPIVASQATPAPPASVSSGGVNHGFAFSRSISSPGAYSVCAYAIGMAPFNGGSNPQLGCSTVQASARPPIGSFDSLTRTESGLQVSGWSLDRDVLTVGTQIHAYVTAPNGATNLYGTWATTLRSDIGATYPGAGPNHGYELTVPATQAGTYQVCVYAIGAAFLNRGANVQLGCRSISTAGQAPIGSFDTMIRVGSGIQLFGWTLQPNAPTSSTQVHLYVTSPNGATTLQGVWASNPRSDIAAAFPGAGPNHGFSAEIPVAQAGTYTACLYAIGIGWSNVGMNTPLGCRSISTAPQAPVGSFDAAFRTEGGIWVSGWTVQRDMPTTSTNVHVYVTAPDGSTTVQGLSAANPRSDIASAFPGAGPNHGFGAVIPATQSGNYRVCVYAIAAGAWNAGANPLLGCRTVAMTTQAPTGSFDAALKTTDGIWVGGWTLQRDAPTVSTQVRIDVVAPDNTTSSTTIDAANARPDIAAAFPGAGPNHGFGAIIAAAQSGSHQVCATALGAGPWNAGASFSLGCKMVLI